MKKKGIKSRLKIGLYILLVFFPCMEIAIRIVGGKPYYQENYSLVISPSHAYEGHDSLGIQLNPGVFEIIVNDKIKFVATHTDERVRKTLQVDTVATEREIAVLGCSFTYGYGVNDNEHFTSLLQKQHPNYNFTNYGVIGYGTIQSYLQLKKKIENNQQPHEVILVFSSFHLERNALAPAYKRALKIGFNQSMAEVERFMDGAKFPYCSSVTPMKLKFLSWDSLYTDWIGRSSSAAVNYVQTAWDNIQTKKIDLIEISKEVVLNFSELCQENDIRFNLILLDTEKVMTDFSEKVNNQGFSIIKVGFDFSDSKWTNLPYDMHPNREGHVKIAEAINQIYNNQNQSL